MALEKILKNSSGVPTGEYERVAGGTLYADNPLGTILPFGSSTIPTGWLLCDGTAISRTTYSELFAVIGESFGVGDGSTTFNLPDMREAVPKGAGLTGHTVGAHVDADGLAVGEFLDDRIQDHNHSVTSQNVGSGALSAGVDHSSGTISYYTNKIGDIGRSGATTEVKSVGVNYIIKAKMVALPADFMSAVDEYLDTENILWENQSPSSPFSAQTVTLANSNYRYLTVYYKEYTGRNYDLSVKFPKGAGCYLNKIDCGGGSNYFVYNRICDYRSSTELYFADAYQSTQELANNDHLIPIKIVGSMT